MTIQFNRNCKLVVGLDSGSTEALDLSEFRVRFEIKQAMVNVPGHAEFWIYNLSKSTMNRFKGKDQDMAFYAGYGDDLSLVFAGKVFQFRQGRENQTDTYLYILGVTADRANHYAVVNETLAKGYKPEDVRQKILASLDKEGSPAGFMEPLPEQAAPRGKVLFDQARKHMDSLAATFGLNWGYLNNQVVMMKPNSNDSKPAVVLAPATGLIGMPQLTDEGLFVTCLLNNRIYPGRKIQVDQSLLQTEAFSAAYQDWAMNAMKDPANMMGEKGFYNVVSVNHFGDTRGDDWYTNMVAWGINAKIAPISGVGYQAI